jgi:hypothetical protein
MAVLTSPARAHGPCPECLVPEVASPGDRIDADYPTYRVIWNPTRVMLTPGPKPFCYGCQLRLWRHHVPNAPSSVVYTRRPRVSQYSFKVPQVAPGKYLVALFDGSEGGTHYTWDFVTVTPSDSTSNGLPDPLIPVLAVAAITALASALWFRRRADG